MKTKETLIIIRNILYKCFFIGLFLLIVAMFLYMPHKCFFANIYQANFGVSTDIYYNMWVAFIGLIKTIIIFLFLVPALAIHWTTRK